MLNRLLQYNYSAIGIFIFIALLKLALFLTGQVDSGTYSSSIITINNSTSIGGGILAALVTVCLGTFILINSEKHAKRNDFSYWLVLIFGVQMSFNGYYAVTSEHIGLFFFILSFYFFSRGIASVGKSRFILNIFNLSLSIAVGTIFTPELIYTLPLFWICHNIIYRPSLRGLFASVLGIVLPFFIIDSFIFIYGGEATQYTHLAIIEQLKQTRALAPRSETWMQLSHIGPAILTIVSLIITFSRSKTAKTVVIKFNRVNSIVYLYLVIMLITKLLPYHLATMLVFVPASYFYSNLQVLSSNTWQRIYVVTILISVALSYPPVIKGIISLYEMIF